jgi:hypothetical protein
MRLSSAIVSLAATTGTLANVLERTPVSELAKLGSEAGHNENAVTPRDADPNLPRWLTEPFFSPHKRQAGSCVNGRVACSDGKECEYCGTCCGAGKCAPNLGNCCSTGNFCDVGFACCAGTTNCCWAEVRLLLSFLLLALRTDTLRDLNHLSTERES